jgi:SWI/SNF-related matrix-associated actin-dependent regulator 1 of chromatin subfamily A
VYFAESSFAEKDALKSAGFIWDKIVKKHWATHDPDVAGKLARHAEPTCQTQLAKAKRDRAEKIYKSMAASSNMHFPVPDGLAYLPFQNAGIEFMLSIPASLNADDMGLGKTIQAIGVINAEPMFKHILVFTKASLKINWKRELEKWLVCPMHVEICNGEFPHADVVIINYDIALKHYDAIRSEQWDAVILDEAHMLTNPRAQRTRAIYGGRATKNDIERTPISALKKVILDGTPARNWLTEMFGALHWLDPLVWNSFKKFALEYSGVTNNGWGNDYTGKNLSIEQRQKRADRLQKKLRSTLMLRRLKKDVMKELPPVRHQVIELPCPPEFRDLIEKQLAHYDAGQSMIDQLQQCVNEARLAGNRAEYEAAMAALGRGKSAAFAEISAMRHAVGHAKLDLVKSFLKDMLEQIDKVVCFGHHQDVLEDINAAFASESVIVYGPQGDTERQVGIDTFQQDPNCKLFIGSIRAAGEGITLTASSNVVFAEFDWTPGQMEQAIARAHRIGQTSDSVMVTYLVLEGSLDARMISTFVDKAKVINAGLNHDELKETVQQGRN